MSINDILNEIDTQMSSDAGKLYSKVRGMYGYTMLDTELIVRAYEDGKITKEELSTLCEYCKLK
ncbi:MAG: hypothetical protein NC311_05900 [Muribaculaceae bacterium]|nr:hypothetical protein [Muribaculaceae bacterium]